MNLDAFKIWLQQQGAGILDPQRPHEILRVRARGTVHVLSKNKDGFINWEGLLLECRSRFMAGARMSLRA